MPSGSMAERVEEYLPWGNVSPVYGPVFEARSQQLHDEVQ